MDDLKLQGTGSESAGRKDRDRFLVVVVNEEIDGEIETQDRKQGNKETREKKKTERKLVK